MTKLNIIASAVRILNAVQSTIVTLTISFWTLKNFL